MQNKLKNKIEKELKNFIRYLDKAYSLNRVSPLLFNSIKEFVLRKGKRLRPTLFVVGYLGFARSPAPNLYRAAISFEFLHDYMLVHDDIVDKSATRRGKPSMYKMLDNHLKRFKKIKFDGQDLAIVTGDMMHSMAIDAFLSIKADARRKEKALSKFISAAARTAMGEFIELLSGGKDIERITKEDIYRIYDYKTSCYTFASPLSCGAILGGANSGQANRLYKYGLYLGRAFQIKDDILGLFGEEKKIGKSALTDLQEAKKTLLIWYAYKNSSRKNKLVIKRILAKDKVNKSDLIRIRKIITSCGGQDSVKKEILSLREKARGILNSSKMRKKYKTLLNNYSGVLLK